MKPLMFMGQIQAFERDGTDDIIERLWDGGIRFSIEESSKQGASRCTFRAYRFPFRAFAAARHYCPAWL